MVNTFLPLSNMAESCKILDVQRLGKQRSEIKIILAALTGVRFKKWKGEHALPLPDKRGYLSHSATKMWKGHELALAYLGIETCETWAAKRGHGSIPGSTGYDTWYDMYSWRDWLISQGHTYTLPDWYGWEAVHSSHRQVLLFKDEDYYSQFGWEETPMYSYVWPV